ncbi:MAG: hypothetical protein ACLRVB_02455 [Blautia sp.]
MIHIETDRIYAIYVRTNRRVRWRYAEYGGRYETVDEAVAKAKEHYPNDFFEYLIEDITTGKTVKQECVAIEKRGNKHEAII